MARQRHKEVAIYWPLVVTAGLPALLDTVQLRFSLAEREGCVAPVRPMVLLLFQVSAVSP